MDSLRTGGLFRNRVQLHRTVRRRLLPPVDQAGAVEKQKRHLSLAGKLLTTAASTTVVTAIRG